MAVKKPSRDDFRFYDGAHTKSLWGSVGEEWECPGCGRTKFELLRWARRKDVTNLSRGVFWGWLAPLARHHDHGAEYTLGKEDIYRDGTPRFSNTIICDQCNSADGAAKRKLQLPRDFSFSPAEIRQFVVARPHDKHQIDYEKALEIYKRIEGQHE